MVNLDPIILAHEEPFLIGEVTIRPATREIVHHGAANIVEPRVMQLLVALHRAAGGVVSKDDLIRLCWEGRIVGEDAINRVVSRLRHDAAEKAGGSFRIETITKVGYRLVDGMAREPGLLSIDRRRAMAIGGAAAIAAAGVVSWRLLDGPRMPPEASELIEQGWSAMREGTVDQYASAIAKFRGAVELAPDHAEPWGALALAYQNQATFAPSGQVDSLRARGVDATRRALAIDPDNEDAIAASVLAVPIYRNWLAYERACRAALVKAPRHPIVNIAAAGLLAQVGRGEEGLKFIDQAIEADSRAPRFHVFKVNGLWDLGRIAEAEAAMDRAYRLWPRHYSVWFTRLYFLAFNGRAQDALAMIADTPNRPIGIPDWNFDATALQAKALGDPQPDLIERAMEAALTLARRGVGFAENAIIFGSAIGRIDDAFAVIDAYFFDRGFAIGEQRFSKEQGMYARRRERHTYFLFASRLAPLRKDPRFDRVTQELGLDRYWQESGSIPDYRAGR